MDGSRTVGGTTGAGTGYGGTHTGNTMGTTTGTTGGLSNSTNAGPHDASFPQLLLSTGNLIEFLPKPTFLSTLDSC
jgi:hypothetical protein